jgi:putative transposase
MSTNQKRELITPGHLKMSVKKQCKLIDLQRSNFYFKPQGESVLNLRLMELIDKQFMEHPYYGVERMTNYLNKDMGYRIDDKRIRRLYRKMGLQTIYPTKNLSKSNKTDYKYPYLLRNLSINRPNHVWAVDITYIPMFRGFMYKFAIIDVYSRQIMGWSVSNTMTKEWCIDVVSEAIKKYGCPEILNSDQGSQFTSPVFIKLLDDNGIKISMDGKGRALDNIYIERYWRSLKYEYVYLNPANGGVELYKGIKKYVDFYNNERRHESLGYETPNNYYLQHQKVS